MLSRLALVLLAACATATAVPAQAQSVPQYLFGYGAQRSLPPDGFRPYSRTPGFDDGRDLSHPSTVRTLCVRICDGYYFPISHATPRSALSRDADACAAACGGDSRLFYHPTHGGDVESMVDLDGFAYASLPNAFRYRKTLVPGCTCRAAPWSEAERQRHRIYAQDRPPSAAPEPPAPAKAH